MKDQNNNRVRKLTIIYLSWFGAGRAPRAPGTVGSLASLPFIYLWSLGHFDWWISAVIIILMTVLACLGADKIQKEENIQDPQWIVVDEVIGMAITWVIASPQSWISWFLCFVAFRFFDIIKIWPASFFDSKVKNGMGTILDDVVSGLYAGIFVYLLKPYFLRSMSTILSF